MQKHVWKYVFAADSIEPSWGSPVGSCWFVYDPMWFNIKKRARGEEKSPQNTEDFLYHNLIPFPQ